MDLWVHVRVIRSITVMLVLKVDNNVCMEQSSQFVNFKVWNSFGMINLMERALILCFESKGLDCIVE